MALDLRESAAAVNAKADALGALLDNGYLRLYTGPRPATANDADTTRPQARDAIIAEGRRLRDALVARDRLAQDVGSEGAVT